MTVNDLRKNLLITSFDPIIERSLTFSKIQKFECLVKISNESEILITTVLFFFKLSTPMEKIVNTKRTEFSSFNSTVHHYTTFN